METAVTPKVHIVILAAGHGKRMQNDALPKVLVPLDGKPLIMHLLEAVHQSGVCERPVVVVGQKAKEVQAALGHRYTFVTQHEQLGTGHAVLATRSVLESAGGDVMVLYGDHPLVSAQTIRQLADAHQQSGAALTMATVTIPDFDDWRQTFYDFGRIIRDGSGRVSAIVETKDATRDQKQIKEVNPSYFCFRAAWLWSHLSQLKQDNAQAEYYLTDLVHLACQEKQTVKTVTIEPREALGVNTAAQLELAHRAARNAL